VPEFLRVEIDHFDHQHGAETMGAAFGVTPALMRDGEGPATELIRYLGTHGTTHVDAPWHYNSTTGGERSPTIDELPLEWFLAPGVVVDFRTKADGDAVDVREMQGALDAAGHVLQPRDIVLVRTGRDEFWADADYVGRGPGVTAEATHWLYDQGVRVMGIDQWGWDRPLHLEAEQARAERRPGIFWAAHQAGIAYCQIERLANLGAVPPTGFTVACFPLRLVGGSAAPARVVGIISE
jgi:kynurenine formamidase